eukprot:PhF_6_TR13910/c1_g1_i1/m.22361
MFSIALLALVGVCLQTTTAQPTGSAIPKPSITDAVNQIQCDVCKGSVKHSWREGVKLKDYCLHHRDESKGCSRSSTTRHAILDIMRESCSFITNHFRIKFKDNKYKLETVHDVSEATPEEWQKKAVQRACEHGLLNNRLGDQYERTLHANIEAGKTEAIILPGLHGVLCKTACEAPSGFEEDAEL